MKYRLDKLKELHELASRVIKLGNEPSTIRSYEGRRYLLKTMVQAKSFICLAPLTIGTSKEHADLSTLASIARIIIENHNTLHFACEIGIGKEEFEFRRYMINQHSSKHAMSILSKLGFPEEDATYRAHDFMLNSDFFNIDGNEAFNTLKEKKKREVSNGKHHTYITKHYNKQISENVEKGLYNLFSSSVHSFHLGLTNTFRVEFHEKGPFSWDSVCFLTVEAMIMYYGSTITKYLALRKGLRKKLLDSDINLLNEITSKEYISDWVKSTVNYDGIF